MLPQVELGARAETNVFHSFQVCHVLKSLLAVSTIYDRVIMRFSKSKDGSAQLRLEDADIRVCLTVEAKLA